MHFAPGGVAAQSAGPAVVAAAAQQLCGALDALGARLAEQARQLAAAQAQVDAYCADVARLRTSLLQAEQQLRRAAASDHALQQQQVITALYVSCFRWLANHLGRSFDVHSSGVLY